MPGTVGCEVVGLIHFTVTTASYVIALCPLYRGINPDWPLTPGEAEAEAKQPHPGASLMSQEVTLPC